MEKKEISQEQTSIINAKDLAFGDLRLSGLQTCGDNIYWLENVIIDDKNVRVVTAYINGEIKYITPFSYSVRTRVHEYGGGDYLATEDKIFFSEDKTQHWFMLDLITNDITQITQEPKMQCKYRYADPAYAHNGLILVRETIFIDESSKRELVFINLNDYSCIVLHSDYDFYASPRFCQKNSNLAFMAWNNPFMPWDESILMLAKLNAHAKLKNIKIIAGGNKESVCHPKFSPKGKLYFVSDKEGWWNLYRLQGKKVVNILPMTAEFGLPHWIFATSTYEFLDNKNLLATIRKDSEHLLVKIDVNKKTCERLPSIYNDFGDYVCIKSNLDAVFIAANQEQIPAIVIENFLSREVIRYGNDIKLDKTKISIAEPIRVPIDNNNFIYANYYVANNFKNSKPPLLVFCHGGPTAFAPSYLQLKIQFWTSRGFAVLDVNYRGSTGYGRAYRESLNYNWGVIDVEDCIKCVQFLIAEGKVDFNKIAIRGSSSGGFTALSAMLTSNLFAAGTILYGVLDLVGLAEHTHAFEAHYLDKLIAKFPEEKAIYEQRSPLANLNNLQSPLLIFQGEKDKVVLPSQSKKLVNELSKKNLPYEYVCYEDEGHGFCNPKNIIDSLEREYKFYKKIMGV